MDEKTLQEAEERFLQEAPKIISLTRDERWKVLLNYVEGEIEVKRLMYDKAQDMETIRQIQGVVQGLLFLKALPERLQFKLDEILKRDSTDSQMEEYNG